MRAWEVEAFFLGGSLEAAAYQSLAYDTPLRLGTDFSFSGRYNFFFCLFCCFIRGVAVAATIYPAYAEQRSLASRATFFASSYKFITYPSRSPVRANRK